MAYGFVYVLSNISMPGMYKIGCTEYSPTRRANEISAATGVPLPFSVVCYLEVSNCRAAETEIHGRLRGQRVNRNREFFRGPITSIVDALRLSDYFITFCDVETAVAEFDEDFSKLSRPLRPAASFKDEIEQP
jgi:hypothetical protein